MKTNLIILIIAVLSIQSAIAQKKPAVKVADPTQIIAKNLIEAFQKNDTSVITQKLMPNQINFDKLYNAIYIDNIDLVKLMNLKTTRDNVQANLIKKFKSIYAEGEKMGINWSTIKLGAVKGYNVQTKKASTAFSESIKFTSGGKEYTLIFDFNNWLNTDPKIFVLGDLRWGN